MASKIFVRGTSPVGLPTYSPAGRQWPTDKAVEVEVVDGDEDPKGADGNPDPRRINKARLEQLKKDDRIAIRETAESDANLAKDNAELRRRITELEARLGAQSGATATQASRAGEGETQAEEGDHRTGRSKSR